MNLPTKVCLGAGAFLAMSGGLLALTGFAMGAQTRLDLHWGSEGIQLEHRGGSGGEQEPLEAFTRIDAALGMGDVTVVTGERYAIALEGNLSGELSYEQDGDTLRIRSRYGAWEMAGWEHQAAATIYLPEGADLEKAEMHTSMGDLTLEDVCVEELTANSDMGDICLTGVEVGEAELSLSMGDLHSDGIRTRTSLSVENDMGDVTLDGCFLGETDCELAMGDLSLYTGARAEDYGLDLEVSMGELTLDGAVQRSQVHRRGGPNRLEIHNSMGNVEIQFGK